MAKSKSTDYNRNPSGVVIGIAISMAWQLAVVVIAPVIAGSLLDNKFESAPKCTLIGLAIATLGMIVVVRQAMRDLSHYMEVDTKHKDDE
jgi:F0F1-type ATP synthase assembly protein I